MRLSILFRVRDFVAHQAGNVGTIFAIALLPVVGGVGAAVDFSQANSVKAAMQAAADSTALMLIKSAASTSDAALNTSADGIFKATFNRPEAQNLQVSASYDAAKGQVLVNAAAAMPTTFMSIVAVPRVNISTTAKAVLGGSKKWAVCVLVTDPDSGHTLLVKNEASIDFTNCMVQVNTQNWDAVEARDTSYIHSVNGVNCFTGDIHYGDVTPPKEPTCAMFPDPYESFVVPLNTCDYTNFVTTTGGTLSPGTYCGGLKVNSASTVTLSPGVYYIQNGDLQVLGSSSLVGNGVTFVMYGKSTNVNFDTTGTITLSPTTTGQWAGFAFYWDQPNSAKSGQTNTFSKTTMNLSGILYFRGQTLKLVNGAKVTVNPGSIIADFILPDKANLTLNGDLNAPTAIEKMMQKSMASTIPVLVQ